jgi:hypothetical protein
MTKTFTQDDLLRYLYGETSQNENKVLEILIATDADFQEKYQQLKDVVRDLNNTTQTPSNQTIQKILDFSKEYNLHSV